MGSQTLIPVSFFQGESGSPGENGSPGPMVSMDTVQEGLDPSDDHMAAKSPLCAKLIFSAVDFTVPVVCQVKEDGLALLVPRCPGKVEQVSINSQGSMRAAAVSDVTVVPGATMVSQALQGLRVPSVLLVVLASPVLLEPRFVPCCAVRNFWVLRSCAFPVTFAHCSLLRSSSHHPTHCPSIQAGQKARHSQPHLEGKVKPAPPVPVVLKVLKVLVVNPVLLGPLGLLVPLVTLEQMEFLEPKDRLVLLALLVLLASLGHGVLLALKVQLVLWARKVRRAPLAPREPLDPLVKKAREVPVESLVALGPSVPLEKE
ncbi:hypothetical protein P7K49_018927 [Saguinus oedipus]|uniref:Uncharacterized protein n=1 Tax=Saguinus oedipus TaxID=9490 RepID=A0ABQ9UVY2_SAGOE|nr:hypothetical protein P7K49_018927 [Saguinus oedipus]